MRTPILSFITLAALLFAAWVTNWPGRLLEEATGSSSQTLCSKTFVSGLDPEEVFREHLRPEPGMWLIAWAMTREVDHERRNVHSSIGGFFTRDATYAEGRGCTLRYPGFAPPAALPPPPETSPALKLIAGDGVVSPSNPAVARALEAAFSGSEGEDLRTKAVVIVHQGHVIAERYARGYGPQTRLLGHSITKSFINALAGVLVREGRLSIAQTAPVPQWQDIDDPRRQVTVEQLMRMNAGFGFDEGSGSSAATQIWFRAPDTARASAEASLQSAPGTQWGYSSRSYALLARIIQDRVGGTPQALRDFAVRELTGPLGMTSFTPEFDATGTFMGGQASLATARDWARLGLLYLHDGQIDGKRILPEGWVKWSTTPTLETGYGAGFWLNTTDTMIEPWGMKWGLPGAPADAFMARGYMGQYIIIVPSAQLVIVRFGHTHEKGAGVVSAGALVQAVIAALAAN